MNFVVYVLESKSSGRLYIGQTSNWEQRLTRHQDGRVLSTRGRGPWKVLAKKMVPTRSAAMKEEQRLKALKRPERVRAEIERW